MAARQKEVCQALARFCSQVSGEAISEDQVKLFRFRDWSRFTQVQAPPLPIPSPRQPCLRPCFCFASRRGRRRGRRFFLVHVQSAYGQYMSTLHANVGNVELVGWLASEPA